MIKDKSTRREFLSIAAMTAAAAGINWTQIDALAQKLKVKDNYPAVIIGSGIGGLTCAAYLAKAGFPITLLEKHSIPGGYATSFNRGNYDFDVSLEATSVHNNASYEVYRELGLLKKIQLVPLSQSHRIIMEGMDLMLPDRNPQAYIDLISSRFPHEKNGIKSFVNKIIAINDETYNLFLKKGNFIKLLFPLQYSNMWKIRNQTLSELLDDHVKDRKVQSILGYLSGYYGLPPSRLSGFYYATGTGDYIKNGSYYIRSRSQNLSNALVAIIQEHGGKVFFDTAAEKIIVKDGAVTGVKADDGSIYKARIVVSNANAPDTFQKMLTGFDSKSYIRQITGYRPSISSFCIFLGLRGELRGKIPGCSISINSEIDVETNFDYNQKCDAEKASFGVTLYDNYYQGYSRPHTSTVKMTLLSGYKPWKRFEKDYFAGKKKEYQKEKRRIADILINRTEKRLITGLRSMIEVMEISTPLTNITFTRNPEGAIYGYEQSIGNSFMNRIKNSTPVKGLYLASAWGNPGGGYTGVMRGGEDAFRAIMDDL